MQNDNTEKDIEDLLKKINNFKNENFSNKTNSDIEKMIVNILGIKSIKENTIQVKKLPTSEHYFRVRNEYDYIEDYKKNNNFDIKNLLGNPEAPLARMNVKNEQGLYLSNKFETAMLECDVKEQNTFSVAIFIPKTTLNVIATSISNKQHNTSNKKEIIKNFIYDCLTMPVDKEKNIYRITNTLLKILYKSYNTDGLLYYSSKRKNDFNLFINKNSVEKLELKYVFTCKYENGLIITNINRVEDNELFEDVTEEEIKDVLSKSDFVI